MSSEFIKLGKEQLHYLKWGHGKKILLAFHGYNNEAAIFADFKAPLAETYTILSFDLPHHGRSAWTDDLLFSREDLALLVRTVMETYGATKISLLGYSMGGRVCLTVIEMMPEIIEKVLLIAPDGLVAQPFYYFLTHTYIGRKLFSSVLRAPKIFFGITDWLHKKRWTDAARHKFVTHYMGSDQARKFLRQVWPAFRDIVPDRKKLKAAIREYHIPVCIFMGAHDHIIPPAYGEKFKQGLGTVELQILEKGHRVFDHDNVAKIAPYLL